VPFGSFGRAIYPLLLVSPALSGVLPPALLVLSLVGVLGHGVLVWSAIVTAANLTWWLGVYALLGMSPAYALLHPLGSGMMFYIAARSIVRGNRVQWKDRSYVVQ
jgi:hypothetical protein